MKQVPPIPRRFVERLDNCSLNDEEKAAVIKRAEEQVAKEIKAQEEEAFFQKALRGARSKHIKSEEMQEIVIDLPGHAFHILIDGVEYLHGYTYREPKHKCETLREIMQRAWNHEDDVGGANRAFYHQPAGRSRPRGIVLTRAHANQSAKAILGG